MTTGLALAGGGSKGIYQIGAWSALAEHGCTFDCIVGTSVGAVNGALITQGDFDKALHMWQHLRMDQCLAFSDHSVLKETDILNLRNADTLLKEYFKNRGLDTEPFRKLIESYIDEEAVRSANTEYGLMAATIPDMSPVSMWISQIEQGSLIKYIMASSRLPGLKRVQINGQQYIDGGVVENLPLSMLKKRGIHKIIAIDIRNNSPIKLSDYSNHQIMYIHNQQDLGNIFDLSPEHLRRNISLGYLDTLKALGILGGEIFSFENDDYRILLKEYGYDTVTGLEQAALAYDMDRTLVWDIDKYIALINHKRKLMTEKYKRSRQDLQIEQKLRQFSIGKLKSLKMMPDMRLAFFIELTANLHQNQSSKQIPIKLFKNLDLAGRALCQIRNESNCRPDLSTGTASRRTVPARLTKPFEITQAQSSGDNKSSTR